jgi:hypothetical protein
MEHENLGLGMQCGRLLGRLFIVSLFVVHFLNFKVTKLISLNQSNIEILLLYKSSNFKKKNHIKTYLFKGLKFS